MSENDERGDLARTVFAGLTPTTSTAVPRSEADRLRLARGVKATMPIVLVGAMAVTFNIAGPAEQAQAAPKRPTKAKSELSRTFRDALSHAAATVKTGAAAPVNYTVKAGDTISSIAGRYGLSTASVLALNGLGWKSLIFPGQVLKLSSGAAPTPTPTPAPSSGGRYTIKKGDTITRIAAKFGVSTQSVLTANGLGWSSIIYPGQTIRIPGSTIPAENVSSVTPVEPDESQDPPSTPVVSEPAPPPSVKYTIRAGDTISSIAQKFGVSINSILKANDLSLSSIIYAGRTLTIPGVAGQAGSVTPLSDEMKANARIIIQVGRELNVPSRGIIIALAAAMQESSLRNIDYGDRDSLGLFQQRPSTGWGTPEQILDAAHSTRSFFGGPSNPNKGKTRGLLDISGWESMTLTQAAQKVQISAYPDAYAKWEASATAWFSQLG